MLIYTPGYTPEQTLTMTGFYSDGCMMSVSSPELLSRSQSRVLEKLEVIPQHTGPVTAGVYDGIRRYLTKVNNTHFNTPYCRSTG